MTTDIALVFPGQGSQSIGMSEALAEEHPLVDQIYQRASDVLGYDLGELVQNGPEEDLNDTERTQPALLAAGYACWQVWKEEGGKQPSVMAGHSLGEYTALVCAESIEFETAVALVAERGQLMQTAVPAGKGAMAAILGLTDEVVIDLCNKTSGSGATVSAANFNSPGQVVVAGDAAAVEALVGAAKAAGAKRAVKLAVSVPSHCDLMKGAARDFSARLADISIAPPKIPVIHNMDVASYSEPDAIRRALTEQLFKPVRWVEVVREMATRGVNTVYECGPGKVLTGLNKRIDKSLMLGIANSPESIRAAITSSDSKTESA